MKEIKAFVGHSFSDADAELVGKFIKYFDSLARSHPQFSWQSAERAEPRILTEKVLRIIADKNTFIGICTRKEKAISDAALSPPLFQPNHLKAPKDKYVWKTSDWVIQEIGMAVGKGLDVILLVENGVRDPGGLQGDIEYIPFERDLPEKSFNKILEMLSVLAPKASTQLTVTSDAKPSPDEQAVDSSENDYLAIPDAKWDRIRYEIAAYHAISTEKSDHLKTISEAYRATDDASVGDNAATWNAMIEYWHIVFGKGGKLERLKEIADQNQKSAGTLAYLANGYARFKQHALSAETFMRAYAAENIPKNKAGYAENAVNQFSLANQSKLVNETLEILRKLASGTPSAEGNLINAVLDLAEREKNQDVELAVLERLIEIQPDNHDVRFKLAYKHSEQGSNDLAVYHYLMIPPAERSAMAWNNLGAAYDALSLPAEAVRSFKEASEAGETLAMINLANKLLNGGFMPEAKDKVDKAIGTGRPDKNVGHTLTRLQAIPEEEEEKRNQLVETARPKTIFLQQLGSAAASREPANVGDTWQGPDCVLSVSRNGDFVKFNGSFERDSLGGLLGALSVSTLPTPKNKFSVVYSGTIRGRAIFGTMARERDGATLLEAAGSNKKALMFFGEDGSDLFIMENADTDSPTYERLRRIQLLPTRDPT